ncbi:MAG TPA: class III poly(R)-hydroxyalkanoic acid synthase subunit PhaE [Luteimonas sp.]|nr:class III poly(R)-hydroxyalkanoic acid synthase subunit PhaE [Luteimonas sp.]
MAGNGQDEFEAIARRYWSAWGDGLRAAAGGDAATAGGMPGDRGGAAGASGPFGGGPGMFGSGPFGMPNPFGGSPGMPGAVPGFATAGGFGVPGAMFGAAQPAGAQAWRDGMDWWARAVQGGRSDADDAVGRINGQARDWFAQMQQVAARFAGQDGTPADITQAWKQALGSLGQNPLAGMLDAAQAGQGFDAWMKLAAPFVAGLRDDARGWLAVPGFGVGREHQERLQRLLQAQLDHQQHAAAFQALLQESSQRAYAIFEARLSEREAPGLQIRSTRALFDLWIEAAEEAYAESALSPGFREAYGRMVNAQMRLRAAVQGEVEQVTGQLGMPTRSELDGAHRKIAELERAVRRLRDGRAAPAASSGSSAGATPEAATGDTTAVRRGRATAPAARHAGAARAERASRAPAAPATTASKSAARTRRAAPTPAGRRARPEVFSRAIPAAPAPLDGAAKTGKKGKR